MKSNTPTLTLSVGGDARDVVEARDAQSRAQGEICPAVRYASDSAVDRAHTRAIKKFAAMFQKLAE